MDGRRGGRCRSCLELARPPRGAADGRRGARDRGDRPGRARGAGRRRRRASRARSTFVVGTLGKAARLIRRLLSARALRRSTTWSTGPARSSSRRAARPPPAVRRRPGRTWACSRPSRSGSTGSPPTARDRCVRRSAPEGLNRGPPSITQIVPIMVRRGGADDGTSASGALERGRLRPGDPAADRARGPPRALRFHGDGDARAGGAAPGPPTRSAEAAREIGPCLKVRHDHRLMAILTRRSWEAGGAEPERCGVGGASSPASGVFSRHRDEHRSRQERSSPAVLGADADRGRQAGVAVSSPALTGMGRVPPGNDEAEALGRRRADTVIATGSGPLAVRGRDPPPTTATLRAAATLPSQSERRDLPLSTAFEPPMVAANPGPAGLAGSRVRPGAGDESRLRTPPRPGGPRRSSSRGGRRAAGPASSPTWTVRVVRGSEPRLPRWSSSRRPGSGRSTTPC